MKNVELNALHCVYIRYVALLALLASFFDSSPTTLLRLRRVSVFVSLVSTVFCLLIDYYCSDQLLVILKCSKMKSIYTTHHFAVTSILKLLENTAHKHISQTLFPPKVTTNPNWYPDQVLVPILEYSTSLCEIRANTSTPIPVVCVSVSRSSLFLVSTQCSTGTLLAEYHSLLPYYILLWHPLTVS